MKHSIISITAVLAIILLISVPGCGTIKVKECHFEPVEDPYTGEIVMTLVCTGEFYMEEDLDQAVQFIDPSTVVLDVGGGSANVTSLTGGGSVKKRTASGTVVASGNFTWVRYGNSLLITNPSSVSSVLNSAQGQALKYEFMFKGMVTSSSPGLNTIVAVLFHDGQAYLSEQESWYCGNEGVGGLQPTDVVFCDI